MISARENEFRPDYALHPGVTLSETLAALGMSQAQLAERTGRPKKTINEIIKGKASITPETAIQLERVLGLSASFWNNLERQFQDRRARLDEAAELEKHVQWLRLFPLRAMARLGWIQLKESPIEQLREALGFFGVASPHQWDEVWSSMPVAFRKSVAFEADSGAVAAWLRKGELDAQRIECSAFSPDSFRLALREIRRLTTKPPDVFCPITERLAAEAGVAVVFVPELPKIRASGATRWLSSSKALIQLSLRYKTDDHLWFTFFHEAGHILLHGKTAVFLEGNGESDEKEKEANRFAATWLIPPSSFNAFMRNGAKSKAAISRFAHELGISPGIVVGQLQHAGYLPPSHCNDLKQHLRWSL
jgi:addiction module HigA family antidote